MAIWKNWQSKVELTEKSLIHDASMMSAIIDASLIDAAKLLEITKDSLEQLNLNQTTSEKIHKILNESADRFSFYQQSEAFGLLFYVDKSGKIVAQNIRNQLPDINVTDRRYFKELHSNPTQRYAIGNLVKGRVKGEWVFHIAAPVLNASGKFSGLVLQQLNPDQITSAHNDRLNQSRIYLQAFLPEGLIVLSNSVTRDEFRPNGTMIDPDLVTLVNQDAHQRGVIPFENIEQKKFTGFVKSPAFGLTTTASISMATVIQEFLIEQQFLLLYTLVSGLIVSYIFFLFYRKSIAFELVQIKSLHDELTGLYNRRGLDEALPALLNQAERDNKPISVLFIDIDHFKIFNDQFGHEVGDQVLINLSKTIENVLHRPLDFICRWGGEEFVVVLPNTDENGAVHIAEAILSDVRLMNSVCSIPPCEITVSIGLSSMHRDTQTNYDDMVDQADKAMLIAKSNGRNCIAIYGRQS